MNRGVVPASLQAVGFAFFFLGGCAVFRTEPLALISQHGEILRGTDTFTPSGEQLSMTNGKTTCSGATNDPLLQRHGTQTLSIVCSDGRTGIATLRRDGGDVRFSDGTAANYIIGEAANRI
ncbi:MAG TPA: hypothetical protein VIE66_05305 [Methylocella sp.]|jgi:hypothetical protein